MKFSPMKQQGFTLIELVLVLGVIALIAIAAFLVYPSVVAGTQANTESTDVTAITACVKTLYGSTGSYTGLSTTTAIQGHCPPSTMVAGNYGSTTMNSVWGQLVNVAVNTNPVLFDITYSNVPTAACLKFVADIGSNFDKVVIGSTTVKDTIAGDTQVPFSPANVITGCTAADPAPSIIFTSR